MDINILKFPERPSQPSEPEIRKIAQKLVKMKAKRGFTKDKGKEDNLMYDMAELTDELGSPNLALKAVEHLIAEIDSDKIQSEADTSLRLLRNALLYKIKHLGEIATEAEKLLDEKLS